MRGRRSQPAAVKEARGNPGRRPINDDAAASALSDDALAVAPPWLSVEARKVWDRLAPDLTRMRLLARPDVGSFGRYCEWFAHWLRANKALNKGELVVVTTSEHVEMERLNKNLQAALLIEKRLVDIEDRFGLNPAMRQRIFAQRSAAGAVGTPLFGGEPDAASNKPSDPKGGGGPIGLLN